MSKHRYLQSITDIHRYVTELERQTMVAQVEAMQWKKRFLHIRELRTRDGEKTDRLTNQRDKARKALRETQDIVDRLKLELKHAQEDK